MMNNKSVQQEISTITILNLHYKHCNLFGTRMHKFHSISSPTEYSKIQSIFKLSKEIKTSTLRESNYTK